MVEVAAKAAAINRDLSVYGTFAEIGAGQEVARYFFKSGGASRTVAKSMSAYDMVISDDIYGVTGCKRYVSQERLAGMLDHEFGLLLQRLSGKRDHPSRFFAFANTVTTGSVKRQFERHGWVGLRFQAEVGEAASTIHLHVRMLDRTVANQQEALGKLGVSLIYSCYEQRDDLGFFLEGLLDEIGRERLEIDYVHVEGPAFASYSDLGINLYLVQNRLSKGFLAGPGGELTPPIEGLFQKRLFSVRGSFYPFSLAHRDMIHAGYEQFKRDQGGASNHALFLQLPVANLTPTEEQSSLQRLQNRLQILHTLGYQVLISCDCEYDELISYYRRYTSEPLGLGIGIRNLAKLFNREASGSGQVLGFFGRVFQPQVTMYVYPWLEERELAEGRINQVRFDHPGIPEPYQHLFHYLALNGHIQNIERYQESCLGILSSRLLSDIQSGNPAWQKMVPEEVRGLMASGVY